MANALGAIDLSGGLVDIPEWYGGVGHESFRSWRDPVDLEIVPGSDALHHQLGLAELEEALRCEAGDVRVEHLGVDAGLIHQLEPLVDVERCGVRCFVGRW